jgi:UDP-3-O-[3-hydroxymyristoyl] glucosamine N-acyltransferase
MTDPRFYEALGPVAAETLAAGLVVSGDKATQIREVASFGAGDAHALSYVHGKWSAPAGGLHGCIVASAADAETLLAVGAAAVIQAPSPRAAFARLSAQLFRQREWLEEGLAPRVEPGAVVAPSAVLSPGCAIGAGTRIGPFAAIGPGVTIGRGCSVGPHVSIQCALIGDQVSIGPGAVIGERGFGVAVDQTGFCDVPHFGRVILQDRVYVGANSTVDRGTLDDTVVGEDTKIDNLCQIAHNVRLGRGVMIAAFGGISGSSAVGDRVLMGGRVGLGDHVTVGDGASIAAGAGITSDVPAGETWGGYPGQKLRQWMRETAWLRRAVRKGHGGS